MNGIFRVLRARVVSSAGLSLLTTGLAFAEGIPEPGLVLYGTVRNTAGGQDVRLTSGTLTWTFQPGGGGSPVTVTTALTNLHDQFSYLLIVPCESEVGGLLASSNVLRLASPALSYARTNVLLDGQPIYLVNTAQASFALPMTARGKIERVDLVLQRADVDSDGDGLPDWWETLYFAGNADPNADPDGDGMSNLAEYRAGTNPTDRNSVFAFIRILPDAAGGLKVEWSSISNRTYVLQRSTNLPGGFVDLQTGIQATPPMNSLRDASAIDSGPYFYRLRVQY